MNKKTDDRDDRPFLFWCYTYLMKRIQDLISVEKIEELASRSNFRYGKEIAKNGEIEILDRNAFNIVARVKDGGKQARIAELRSTTKGLRWKCTCSNRKDLFCQHIAAVGIKFSPDYLSETISD